MIRVLEHMAALAALLFAGAVAGAWFVVIAACLG